MRAKTGTTGAKGAAASSTMPIGYIVLQTEETSDDDGEQWNRE